MALRSLALLALVLAAAQVYADCGCGHAHHPPPPPSPQFEEGCCPGAVVEKSYVVNKAVHVPYSYSVPTKSRKCYSTTSVNRQVVPSSTISQKCNEQVTTVKVPTTDITTDQQQLCKRTCTTSEYIIQIPIVETTCTSHPLCKKTTRSQQNTITTTSAKTSCAKTSCTSSKVIETPHTQTLCQDYQGSIIKSGTRTEFRPEVKKTCVQLPPYRCLKPVHHPPPPPPPPCHHHEHAHSHPPPPPPHHHAPAHHSCDCGCGY